MSDVSLASLSTELLRMFTDQLAVEDLKNLSLVHSTFRIATTSCLFKVLRVNCPLPKDHMLEIVTNKHGAHVLELRLNVTFFPEKYSDTSSDEEYFKSKWYWSDPPDSVWAREAADISAIHDLIQFKGLPRCKSLTLHIDDDENFEVNGDWDDNEICCDSIYFFIEPESWERVDEKEQKYT
ncbi:hypothetical protein ACHAPU_010489, partial [Fusarium lateritium]